MGSLESFLLTFSPTCDTLCRMGQVKQDGPIRQRYAADRTLLLLLYRPASPGEIERLEDGSVAIKMGPVARLMKYNSSKMYDQLLFLQSIGYIRELDSAWRWGWVRIVVTPPLCSWKAQA
jgi:hypothetical protein